ncbi:MAG: hypothetical protein ACLUKN_01275 [Bacilli bacterium]
MDFRGQKVLAMINAGVLTSKGIDANARLLIASYTQLRRNKSEIDKIKFELAVLDEAQFIKILTQNDRCLHGHKRCKGKLLSQALQWKIGFWICGPRLGGSCRGLWEHARLSRK